MKAVAVFPGAQEVRLIECEEPQIRRPTDVKVRVLEVGVCGTDREICAFEYGAPPPGSDYLIIGHEALGQVVAVGDAVEGIAVGDLVVPMVRRPCNHPDCLACQSGHQDFCATGDYVERGIKGQHGFMSEFFVEDARYVLVVPERLRDVAVLVEPLTIATKALIQVVAVARRFPWFDLDRLRTPGGRTIHTLVLGAGPVGLLGALALRSAGFETYVYDRNPAPNTRSQIVESLGAHYISEESLGEFAHLVDRVLVVYEATGSSELAFRAMRVLAPNSIFIFTGVPALKGPKSVDTDQIMRDMVLKNQVVLGTVNAGRDAFEAAIALLSTSVTRWPGKVQGLITGRFPVDAYRATLLERPPGVKSVLTF